MTEQDKRDIILRNQERNTMTLTTILKTVEGIEHQLTQNGELLKKMYSYVSFKPAKKIQEEKPVTTPSTPDTPIGSPVDFPPTANDLRDSGIDMSLVEYNNDVVKPVKFLGDIWQGINETLKQFGYSWVSDGKNSRWQYGEVKEKQKKKPKGKDANFPFGEGEIIEVEGDLLDDPTQSTFIRRDGNEGSRTNFRLKTSMGTIRVTLWDQKGDEAMMLEKGETINLTSMKVTKPYKGVNQVSSTNDTRITDL